MNKFEKLIELIVNEDNKAAKKLFHDIVVEKSRVIYESLLDEEDYDEVEEMEDEVDADEEGLSEGLSSVISVEEAKQLLDHIDGTLNESDAGDLLQRVAEHFKVEVEGLIPVLESNGDALLEMAYGEAEEDFGGEDEEAFPTDDAFGGDGEEAFSGDMEDGGDYAGDEMGGDVELGGEEEIEDRVVDLEDAIDELKAEFDALIGDEGMDDELDGDFGGEEGDEEMDDVEDMASDVASDDDEEVEQTEESLVREYVEKRTPKVTTQEEDSPNTKSTVAGKNDMGGSAANILGDQAENSGASTPTSGSNKGAGSYQNDPKAKAGKTSFKKKEKATNKTDSEKSILDGPAKK